jgi:hypothetical protein
MSYIYTNQRVLNLLKSFNKLFLFCFKCYFHVCEVVLMCCFVGIFELVKLYFAM